jgi:iron complex transport system permease protein
VTVVAPAAAPARASTGRGAVVVVVLVVLLLAACFASLAWGTRDVSLGTVWDALWSPVDGNNDHDTIRRQRMPRTVVGLLAGLALGLAGALMQGLTRNPIADPGLLGINSGSSLAVIVAIAVFGLSDTHEFVWFAYVGAALAAFLVYGVASAGWEGATPVRLALLGAACTATMTTLITLVLTTDRSVLEDYRFWSVGSLVNRGIDTVVVVLPMLVLGVVLALACARFLNAMALGDDLARGLGQNITVGRAVVALAAVLLCGSATALVGPIAFVGLMVPHVARLLAGPDYRWILALSALLGPVIVLGADVVGRLVAKPTEIEAGLMVAVIGAPVLILLVRRGKAVSM